MPMIDNWLSKKLANPGWPFWPSGFTYEQINQITFMSHTGRRREISRTIEWLPRNKDVQQAELRCVLCSNGGEEFSGVWKELGAHLKNQHKVEEWQILLSLVTGTT